MANEMNDFRSLESVSEECFRECDSKYAYGPTFLMSDVDEASAADEESDCCRSQKNMCYVHKPADPLHVHEVQGLIESAQQGDAAHTHRILITTSEPKPFGKRNHVHEVIFCTDYHGSFCHEGWGTTSGAFQVGDGHVHFLEGVTTADDGHWHKYRLATSLEGIFG